MRRLWTLVSLLTLLASAAWAQIPTKGNVFLGYSYDRTSVVSNDTSNLNGWDATLEGKFLPWIGLVADVDGHYGNHNFGGTSADVTAHNVLFGPRVSVQVQRFRPFAEFLVGAGHISRSNGISDSDTSFVNAVGGGLDYRLAGPVTLRGQLDWINTRFYGQGQNACGSRRASRFISRRHCRVLTPRRRPEIATESLRALRIAPGLPAPQTVPDWSIGWPSGEIHRKSRSRVSAERRTQFS